MTDKPCPVQPPRLLRADSLVETCASCGAWVERYPEFMGENDGFWEKEWEWVVEKFNELYLHISPDGRDSVLSDPPLTSLDWAAVEAWWNEQGIYNVYVGIGIIATEAIE